MYLPYLSFILILVGLASADELNDPHDNYSQAINSYDQSSLGNATQNVADLLQTLALNSSTASQNLTGLTGLTTNLTTANIPTLFNTYQYDSPVYQEAKPRDQSASSSSAQSTLLESSGTNQNFYAKEYTGFDENQKMYIEQQIEQDSKYLPEIFDLPPPVPAQVIEQSASSGPTDSTSAGQVNVFDYGTKINKRPAQSGTIRTAPIAENQNRLNKYPAIKGTVNSIRMANNQEWNVIEKTQGGYINAAQPNYASDNAALKSALSNYPASDDNFSSFDQQYDLTKASKAQIAGQANYNRPIEGTTQIITASSPQQVSSYQYNPQHLQQIISSSYATSPVKQSQTVTQYNPIQQANAYVRKPPCTKSHNAYSNYNQQTDRQRPFYFGWKQQQQRLNNAQKASQAANHLQQQISYPIPSQANQNRYFGMPNQFDQQPFNKGRKCCIVRLVPKPGFNKGQQQQFAASSMPYFNPFQNNLTGMFGVGVNSVVNKIENKKRKVKKLIKAPFMFVNGMKQKAFSSASQFRAPAYPSRPNYSPSNYGPNYVQQQNTFGTKSVSPEYSY